MRITSDEQQPNDDAHKKHFTAIYETPASSRTKANAMEIDKSFVYEWE